MRPIYGCPEKVSRVLTTHPATFPEICNELLFRLILRMCVQNLNQLAISDTVFRRRLRSASSNQVSVPRYRLSTCGRRAFSVAGRVLWTVTDSRIQTFLFSQYTSVFSALEVCYENALYKFTFDIDTDLNVQSSYRRC